MISHISFWETGIFILQVKIMSHLEIDALK
jgi:hypothetical protein